VLDGDGALSMRGDEAEEAWRIVTPVLDAWEADRVPMGEYPAGSDGPPPSNLAGSSHEHAGRGGPASSRSSRS
jgi:glucose-6-phosphate 1-dehydrogenase